MKKLLVAIAALLLVGLAWWWSGVSSQSVQAIESAAAAPVPLTADGPRADERAPPTAEAATPERVAVDKTVGSLRVRVQAKSATERDPLPIGGCLLEVWPGDRALVPFDGTVIVTNADAAGEQLLSGLATGTWQVLVAADHSDEPRSVIVEPDCEARLEIIRPVTFGSTRVERI